MRILLIDDDPVVRHILSTILKGYSTKYLPSDESEVEILTAGSGQEGLELLKSALTESPAPRLLFLDLQLLDMTGLEFLQTAESSLPESVKLPPTITMSAQPLIELTQKHPERDWSLFMQKPFLPDQVIENSRKALGL